MARISILWAAEVLVVLLPVVKATQVPPPTAEELAAITERGRRLYAYDQAAWHATDAVEMANPRTVEGQRYIAKEEDGRWRVAFGKLNPERNQFEISYEAIQQREQKKEFAAQKAMPGRVDTGFFLFAARAMEMALRDFGEPPRPYNIAAMTAPAGQLYVYVYPAQTKAQVYPFGGDVRYLVSAEGGRILEKRQMHRTVTETTPREKGKKMVAGFHKHLDGDLPEDTDVFHVLTQDPPRAEFVETAHFLFQVQADGTIRIDKDTKKER